MEHSPSDKEVYTTSMEKFVQMGVEIHPILMKHDLVDVLNFLNMTLSELVFMNSEDPLKHIELFNKTSKGFVEYSLKTRSENKKEGVE